MIGKIKEGEQSQGGLRDFTGLHTVPITYSFQTEEEAKGERRNTQQNDAKKFSEMKTNLFIQETQQMPRRTNVKIPHNKAHTQTVQRQRHRELGNIKKGMLCRG